MPAPWLSRGGLLPLLLTRCRSRRGAPGCDSSSCRESLERQPSVWLTLSYGRVVDECPYCGEPGHSGGGRAQVGQTLADLRLLRQFDVSVADVLLKIADLEARVRYLERENKEWH